MSALLVILTILQIAAGEAVKLTSDPTAKLSQALVNIAKTVAVEYQKETGQPLDLAKIPPETPVA